MTVYCTILSAYAVLGTLIFGTYVAADLWWTHGPRKGGDR